MRNPPAEAYGRVTNPQRYSVLHGFARELVDRLAEEYLVAPVDGASIDPAIESPDFVSEVMEISPSPGNGGPLSIALTKFPGLIVRYGRWHHTFYPHCGCDACDESPEELAEEIRCSVTSFVTNHVTERLRRGLRPALLYEAGGSSHWKSLTRDEARRLGTPERLDWPPWPLRGEGQLGLATAGGLESNPGELTADETWVTVRIPRLVTGLTRWVRGWRGPR